MTKVRINYAKLRDLDSHEMGESISRMTHNLAIDQGIEAYGFRDIEELMDFASHVMNDLTKGSKSDGEVSTKDRTCYDGDMNSKDLTYTITRVDTHKEVDPRDDDLEAQKPTERVKRTRLDKREVGED